MDFQKVVARAVHIVSLRACRPESGMPIDGHVSPQLPLALSLVQMIAVKAASSFVDYLNYHFPFRS